MTYSILTPYIIPEEQSKVKKVNIGDGFIVIAIQNLLKPLSCQYIFSTRKKINDAEIEKINSTRALIIAGANQLNDHYTVFPGADLDTIKKITVPIIFFGVGFSGFSDQNEKMSQKTKEILLYIHKKTPYSSWRCFRTIEYLNNCLPEIKGKFLMTGCPVIYGNDLLAGKSFSNKADKIVVTTTERGFWFRREIATINFVRKNYPNADKFLVLHQDFSNNTWKEFLINLKKNQPPIQFLRWYAKRLGFTVLIPKTAEQAQQFYKGCDLHIGSRLHAHLFFLSLAKKSFLTYVDDRSIGFSEYLQFPIVDTKNIKDVLNYDFEIYRRNAIFSYKTMQIFLSYLKKEIQSNFK